ncbi:hypothetical protein [Marinobacter salexigens]|jgi:hypothetical protein|uniref:Ferric reductase like transmembrane component n=1 Tax=Marinobacter salexigens TaxID=1925763 RepID=A0ABS6A7R3_9GAMM|nr:hypothetical protein [Marinobacter salexigens]MBU2874215.1 hypothetical protein [Marinobacter salexigens]
MNLHQSILEYRKGRYGWWALLLILAAIVLFASHSDFQPPNGGTWQGYVLGSIGLALIVWLTALGIVKRRYGKSNVQAWTSAHVYLGASLLIVVSLHSALQIGLNVHSLAYVLMCVVIFSGFIGLYFYRRYPHLMARNRRNQSQRQLFSELNDLNQKGRALAKRCHPNLASAVDTAIDRTAIGGGFLDQLLGRDGSTVVLIEEDKKGGVQRKPVSNRDQQAIIDYVAKCIPRARKQGEAENIQSLLEVVCRRQTLSRQLRQDIKFDARLKVWLWVHVPFTIALLAALAIHILSVFYYW